MYKKILIPTDGSELSTAAAMAGVQFAKAHRAEIFGIYVAPNFEYPRFVDMAPAGYPTEKEYQAFMRNAGDDYLGVIQKAAEAANVKFFGDLVFSDAVAREIVHMAKENECDLIFMGSHGRSGWDQIVLGSVANKVLATCQIPVLVHRLHKGDALQTATN